MSRILVPLALLTAPCTLSAAAVQDERSTASQVAGPSATRATDVAQIAPSSRNVGSAGSQPADRATAPIQLGRPADPAATAGQLSRAGVPPSPPEQLARGGNAALPPQPLSRPADGRAAPGAVTPVGGRDRCDRPAAGPRPAACERAIETRSAEFDRSDPNRLTAEQQLLAEREADDNSGDARAAARRLAETGLDSGSEAAQGVASLVLRPADRRDEEATGSAATDAAVANAILNGGNGPAPVAAPPN